MKISTIRLFNFRIYKGKNEIGFSSENHNKNINIIAGRNGFGKTTFLSALVWCFYGKMMVEVEEKYRQDLRNAGNYEKFLETLLNKDIKKEFLEDRDHEPIVSVEIELTDLSIPSMPCETVSIKRSYSFQSNIETLQILIDGAENELTKEVGYEIFVNDFILPREIAKFFFFDAEKIVTLAEAKTPAELKNLSKAYSEVLGIKKYEDLKKNLETLLARMRRNSAKPHQEEKLQELSSEEKEIQELITISTDRRNNIDSEISTLSKQSDDVQEKLIREGSGITVEELQNLKVEQDTLKTEGDSIKERLKKMMDLVPLVLAGKKIQDFENQIYSELDQNKLLNINFSANEEIRTTLLRSLENIDIDSSKGDEILRTIELTLSSFNAGSGKKLLGYTDEQITVITEVLDKIKNDFRNKFQNIVKEEKNNRLATVRIVQRIKQAEARKENAVAEKLRDEKSKIDSKILALAIDKGKAEEEIRALQTQLAINHKNYSEKEKEFTLVREDKAKAEVTQNLLYKISEIIRRIKEDKKYSLQKSILLGLKKLMHKDNFISNVRVNVQEDVIDIDLLDENSNVIDKESLSKGEQQLYATALLKALVDESGIKFPVLIDSPLQKFDKFHSENIIKEFYPAVSDQVVLFPLLEKELSEVEYEYLHPFLNQVYMIENQAGASSLKRFQVDQLFTAFKKSGNYVHTN